MEVFKALKANKEEKRQERINLQENMDKSFIVKAMRKQVMELLKEKFQHGYTAVVIEIKQERVNTFLSLKIDFSRYYSITQLDETKFMVRPIIISED